MGPTAGQAGRVRKNQPLVKALVSIHDVMPGTMARVEALLEWLRTREVPPVALLTVPGKDWSPAGIQRLRQLAGLGHELVAHGWNHQTRPRRLYHRCHALLISRNVAEHLDHDAEGVFALMERSGTWFARNGLPAPTAYVPPAWALGPLQKEAWPLLPYRVIETTRGIIHTREARRAALPLTGFEADTPLRQAFLTRWNKQQAAKAVRAGMPLRISIHPDDLQLRLAGQMDELIQRAGQFISYRDLQT